MITSEIRSIHRQLEKVVQKSKDKSGKLVIRDFVNEFYDALNIPYYIIGLDLLEDGLDVSHITVHRGSNIPAGFYWQYLRPEQRTGQSLEAGNPFKFSNTVFHFVRIMESPPTVMAIAFRPQLDENVREILVSDLKSTIQQQLRSESIENEFEQARLVQTSLFPTHFDIGEAYDLYCQSKSCAVVSGDAYDVLRLDADNTVILVADASGHGFPAALQARDVIIGIRMGVRKGIKLSAIMAELNRIVFQTKMTSRFVSVFLGELENNGNLFYVNAGHLPPIYIQGEVIASADIRNVVVGPLENVSFKMGFFHINRGGTLVLYTDGIVEAVGSGGEEFGRQRLIDMVRQNIQRPAQEIVEAVFAAIARFASFASFATGEQCDDMTLMVIKRK